MFAVRTLSAARIVAARAPAVQQVRFFAGVEDAGKSWGKKEKAVEEQYFTKIEAEKRKKMAEKIHTSEVRSLLAILGEKHSLSEQQIHELLEWKHGKMD